MVCYIDDMKMFSLRVSYLIQSRQMCLLQDDVWGQWLSNSPKERPPGALTAWRRSSKGYWNGGKGDQEKAEMEDRMTKKRTEEGKETVDALMRLVAMATSGTGSSGSWYILFPLREGRKASEKWRGSGVSRMGAGIGREQEKTTLK